MLTGHKVPQLKVNNATSVLEFSKPYFGWHTQQAVAATTTFMCTLGEIEPNHTSTGCMLMEVDWGGKLRVNHTRECMPSEVDWGAHETHPKRHSITEVDWGGHDPSLYLMDGCMLSEVDWGGHDPCLYHMDGWLLSEVDSGAHDSSPNHMNGILFSEVDWGSHASSFFPYLEYTDHDGDLNDFFMQGLWGELPQRTSSTSLMEHLKDSFDTLDKLKMDFSTLYQSRDIDVHTLFLTLNSMKVATIYLLNGILGRNLCNLHSSGRKA